MMSMDNLDCLFYTPNLFDQYCRDYYRRIGEVLHARGKFWASHACGRVNALRSRVAEVELDGLEGTPHAPLGDIDLAKFRDSIPYAKHVVWGGMTCHEQEIKVDAGARIHDHVKRIFANLRPFHRFVFSSACNTSTNTPWDNIRHFHDACYAYGRN
jgi:uroporphyrinogen-III decarboxylase